MKFKSIIRRIGHSLGVIIPRDVITEFRLGDEIELDVITKQERLGNVITKKFNNVITGKPKIDNVITQPVSVPNNRADKLKGLKPTDFCPVHKGSLLMTCGCSKRLN